MASDELVAWLRAEIDADRDDAAHRLRLSRMTAAHRAKLIEKLDRAQAELAVLGLYERQAAKQWENCMEEDRMWVLGPVVQLLASGYRHREGFKEEWLP